MWRKGNQVGLILIWGNRCWKFISDKLALQRTWNSIQNVFLIFHRFIDFKVRKDWYDHILFMKPQSMGFYIGIPLPALQNCVYLLKKLKCMILIYTFLLIKDFLHPGVIYFDFKMDSLLRIYLFSVWTLLSSVSSQNIFLTLLFL